MEDRIYTNRYLPTPFSKGWKIMFVKMFFGEGWGWYTNCNLFLFTYFYLNFRQLTFLDLDLDS